MADKNDEVHEELTKNRLTDQEIIQRIRGLFYLDVDEEKQRLFVNPDKGWDVSVLDDINRLLVDNDYGPDKPHALEGDFE